MKKQFLSILAAGLMLTGTFRMDAFVGIFTAKLITAMRDGYEKYQERKKEERFQKIFENLQQSAEYKAALAEQNNYEEMRKQREEELERYSNVSPEELATRIEDHKKRTQAFIGGSKAMKQFYQDHAAPQDLYASLVKDEKKVYSNDFGAYGSSYFLKGTREPIWRIVNANRMRNFFDEKKYKTVTVPKKHIFLAGNQWISVAEKVTEPTHPVPLNLTQTQELFHSVVEFGFSDLGFAGQNIMQNKQGQCVFIDTESESFASPSWDYIEKDKAINGWNIKNYILSHFSITDEAKEWLKKEADNLKAQYEHSDKQFESRNWDASLDPKPIDLEALQDYAKEHDRKEFYKQDFFGINAKYYNQKTTKEA